ncbi:uncharacterized protein K441DRAFT_233859 [Cenococcum geophilum 1.58]|uniref:uncharacterized protein n=1 Tax=Cenococcum geophilum 1.58 TaxID=794803 RepID=UPI00358E863F|nr:hypothetical protein K441DRAFT_233859 [Cenococcum geophilum 1.58]
MQCQMQSLDIKRPTKRLNQARASATLIDCPAATAAAVTIPLSYFVLAVSADCSVPTVLDLYRCWIYFTARSTRSFYCCSTDRRTYRFDRPASDRLLLTTAINRSVTAATATAVSTDCYQPTTIDRLPLPRFLLLKGSAARCPTAYYTDQALLPTVLLPTVLPLTVLPLTICFYYCFYRCYYYYYCCYCHYCYRYYF